MESKPKHRPATPSQPAPDIDRNAVDPKAILASIASDPEMPPYVRVSAARALLAQADTPKSKDDRENDVTELALQLLRRK
jgi:hypothetical protein